MERRAFFKLVAKIAGAFGASRVAHAAAGRQVIALQSSPVAGFQYHDGENVWPLLAAGSPLTLVREPDNPYDGRAVRVEWSGRKLGYVPHVENTAVAQLMDRGHTIEARIARLAVSRDPWERIQMEIRLVL